MTTRRTFVIGVLASAAIATAVQAQTVPGSDRLVRAEFARRVQAYVALKEAVAQTVLPLETLRDPAEIFRRTDALATVIRSARSGARQGDIFTPEIAQFIRRAIRDGCDGDYLLILAMVREEYTDPLPSAAVHGRWPALVPVPTMLPRLLAALPPLPPGLQYRVTNNALALIDIDANLIIDFVPDAFPLTTAGS